MSQATLAQFRQLVLQDPVLQQRLQNTADREQFRALVLQLAHERGYDVALADMDHALRLPKHARFPQPGPPMEPAQLSSWVPIEVYWHHTQLMVDWCYMGNRRFTEPFFEQTINALLRHPFNLLFRHQTPIDGLAELQAVQPGVPPAGFIFHMSRCGSTLIAQLLAALPQCIVLSEAGPIDTVVRAHHHHPGISDDQRCVWLRSLLGALAQRRHEQEQHFVIKFDSWNIMDLPIIRRAFPTVPWVFVYRVRWKCWCRTAASAAAKWYRGSSTHACSALIPPQLPTCRWTSMVRRCSGSCARPLPSTSKQERDSWSHIATCPM